MFILSLDTSSATLSVAVLDNEIVLSCQEKIMDRGHGEALIPMIDTVLKNAGIDISDINAVAVAVGPGSFTGVRVGLSTARGIGLALNVPVYGVTNFEAVSYNLLQPVYVILDSKRGDYFTQRFDANGQPSENPKTQNAEDLKAQLPFIAVGDGAEKLAQEINCSVLKNEIPCAVAIGKIAFNRQNHPLPPEPLYLRDADVTV